MPSPADLLHDLVSAVVLVLMVVAWSAGSLVSAFAVPLTEDHLEASSAPSEPVGPDAALDQGRLDAAAAAAKADWQAVRPSADLGNLTFSVADLGGLQLGGSSGNAVTVDADAAGWGWSQMDLGTVVRHEIGHALGLPHGSGLMSPTLSPGESHRVGAEYAEVAREPEPETQTAEPQTAATVPGSDAGESTGSGTDADGSMGGSSGSGSSPQTGGTSDSSDQPADQNVGGTDDTQVAAGTDEGRDAGPAEDTSVTTSVSSSVAELQSLTSALPTSLPMTLAFAGATDGTTGADVITIVDNGDGSYGVSLGGALLGTVSGTDTITIDGLAGVDTLVAPDKAGTWRITRINQGSYQITGGPTFEFSHIENITGAATAAESYRFSDHTGLTGLVDDGSGSLTVAIGDFVRVTGDYDFAQEAKTLTVVGGDAPGAKATNVLKLGGTSGSGFVGISIDLIDSQLGFVGALTSFALAVVTAADESQAWHVFDGTIAAPHLGDVLGLDLDLHLTSLQIAMNGTSENGSHLDLSGSPISVTTGPSTTRTLSFAGSQVSASAPVSLDLGGVLHLNGTLTLTKGGISSVDLNTGLDAAAGALSQIKDVTVATSDPVNGTDVRRSADYSKLWNLQVSALQFAFTNANAFIGSGFGWTDTNTDEVMDKAEVAGGALGLFAGGINLTFLLLTPLGGMPTQKRFLGLKGYVGEVGLLGLDDYLTLAAQDVEFEANLGTSLEDSPTATSTAVVDWVSSFPDPNTSDDPTDGSEDPTPAGYHVFIGGLDPPSIVLDSTDSVVGVSARLVVISISQFVYISGGFSFISGGHSAVDVRTAGLDADGPGSLSEAVPGTPVTEDPEDGSLASTADGTTIFNLPVTTFLLGVSHASLFVGYNDAAFDTGADDILQADELGADAIGLLASDINIGLVLASVDGDPVPGWKLPTFVSLKATIATLLPVGLPAEFVISFSGITLAVNRAGQLSQGSPVGVPVTGSRAWVDWAASFPAEGAGEPGLEVPTGGDADPVLVDFEDPLLGVSVQRVVLAISDFVYITGGFSLEAGGIEEVDVDTRNLGVGGSTLAGQVNGTGGAQATDPGAGLVGATANASTIWNVPVTTTLFGISHASIFVGYNPNAEGTAGTSFSTGTDGILDEGDLSPDAVGFLANNIDIGLVFATVDRTAGSWAAGFPRFFAIKASIGLLTPVGLPNEFVVRFEGVVLSLNRGGRLLSGPLTSNLWVNWESSFPDPDGADDGTTTEVENPLPAGIEVPTGDPESPVHLDFADPVFGISATNVKLVLSDFVFISGGFAFEIGGRENLDVDTAGLGVSGTALAGQVNGVGGAQATDPGGSTLGATANASTIWNLPVVTSMLGISHASVFLGYNPNADGTTGTSFDTGDDYVLDEVELSDDAIGFLASGIDLGLVFASVDKDPTKLWMNNLPGFWSLKASVSLLTPVGLPDEFVLRFEGVVLSLNRGGGYTGAPLSEMWVDWTASFPDLDGEDDPATPEVENPLPAGIEVSTGTGNTPVYVDFEDPVFGVSASNVKLVISDFVFISGGFAFEIGGREDVDVDTAGLGTGGTLLASQINGLGGPQATDDGTLGATANASTIWNLPVVTTLLGISHASVFIGWNPNADGTTGTSFDTGDDQILDEDELSEDAVGFLASGIDLGLVFARVEKDPTKTWMNNLPGFWALKATVALLTPVGLPEEFVLTFQGVQLTINRGGPITSVPQSEAWVNWEKSYPNPEGPVPAGYAVPTGTGNDPVYIDFDDPIFGLSASKVTLAISDFVFVTGGFAFQQGGRERVDVTTSGMGVPGAAFATSVNGVLGPSADDPADGTTRATLNGSHVWNVPVVTTLIGISNASVFVGYNPNADGTSGTSFDTGSDGVLDETDLSDGAIGLLANGITVGIVLARVEPIASAAWDDQLPSFFAVRANIALLTPVGLPDGLEFRFEGVALTLNQGGAITSAPGSNAWIDWKHSLPAVTDVDGVTDPEGLQVPTGLDNPPVTIDFEDPVIGVSAQRVVITIFDFVHVSGGFAFEKGGVETVVVNTGLKLTNPSDVLACGQLAAAATAATLDGVELSSDCATLTGVQVETIKVGVFNASVFVGYNPGGFDLGEDDVLQASELGEGAIGFLAGGINVGFVLASFVRGLFTQTAGEANLPRFYSIKAHVDELMLVGVPDITLTALDGDVSVNVGSKWPTAASSLGAPSIDWAASLPGDESTPAGLEVPTGGTNPSVYLDYDGYLIGGGVNKFFLQISEFVYLSGGFYFEYGPIRDMPLTDGIVDTSLIQAAAEAAGLGVITEFVGLESKELRFMTIGAQDVHAFVGLNGPDWVDADGDGEIDRGSDGQIIDAEVNHDAVGLVLDDVDFALALMTPTNVLDPMRYIALKASAATVALVGIDGLVATARNLIVELNISTPTLYGLPLLPVVDFDQWNTDNPDDQFAVKVAAPETFGGDPVVVPFTFDSALIRASGQFNLNVFGVLALSGSLAFNLGKAVDATLADSGHTVVSNVVTMTIGGSNLLGFVGYVPNSGSAWGLNTDGSVHWVDEDGNDCTPSLTVDCQIVQNPNAIGLLINDLDFGIFVGVRTPSTSDVTAGVFVATNIVIDTFGLIGVPGITALGTLAIMLNLGLALGQTSAAGGIDFKRTFKYDPDGEQEASEGADGSTSLCTAGNPSTDADPNCDDLPGLALDTGDPSNPVLIDFDTTFISVSLAGVLNIVDFVQALGVFYLEADDQGLKLLVDAQLLVGPDKITSPTPGNVSGNHGTGLSPILEIGALGVLIINAQGIAADLDVDFSLNVPGISVNASARILLNSTGTLQQVEIPGRLYDFLSDQASVSSLAQDLLDRLSPCTPQPTGASTTVYCYKIGGTAPDLGNSTTVFNLLHNPSGAITTSGSAGAYVVVLIEGSFDFLGFAQASGLAGVRISGDVFQLVFNLHFSIGIDGAGLDFDSSGFVEINPAGLILDIAVSLDVDVTSLFHLDVSGQLKIKTFGPDKHFRLDLTGRLDILGLFTVTGSLGVHVANDAWDVTVSASGRFGPVNISGSGTIRSDGTFDLSFSAGFQIGPDVVHISADISLRIFMENTRAANGAVCNADDSSIPDCGIAKGGSLKFGFHLHGGAEACAFGICVGISIGVLLDGVISGNPANPSFIDVRVRGCVDLLFGDACATIKVATIRLPGTIFPENDPKLAELQGGVLVLNVGSRGNLRVISPTVTAEDYQIVDLGTASNGTRTIQVNAFGRSRVYKGVTAVTGDFGGGDDSFTLVNGSVPVTVSGGDDSDTLITNGSGSVTFHGNGGADMLIGGSAADILNGGSGNDYLEGRGGIDQLDGGANDDVFVAQIADVFGESPQAGDGVDTYEIIGTTGADGFGVSVAGSTLTMTYAGPGGNGVLNLTAFEKVVLQANQGGDTITVSGNLGAAGLQELTLGLTELTSANDADTIVLDLTTGADVAGLSGGTAAQVFSLARVAAGDTLEYPTPAGGAVPLTTVSWQGGASLLRLVGSGATDTDLLTVNGLAGADVLNVRGLSANTVIDAGDDNDLVAVGTLASGLSNTNGVVDGVLAALTVRGGSGTDTMTIDDSGDGSGDTNGHLTGTLLSGLGLPTTGLVYGQLESLTITLGTGADTFNIDSTSSGTDTTLNGNGGNDTVIVNDDHGPTTVHGNLGDDTVNVITTHGATTVHGDGGNDTVTVTDSFGVLTVNGNDGSDTVTVTDTHATTTVNGGTGADTVTLVDSHGPTAINGGDDGDTITIRDTHATLIVHGDNGADTIRILALHAPTEAYGDAGNDSFLVGSAAPGLGGTLDLIAAYLRLSGGVGTDTVQLDDTGDGTGDIGYVTDGRVAGLGMSIDGGHAAATPAWSVTVANAAGGTYRIAFGGATTAAIAFDAKAKAVQDAINQALGGDFVTVTRSPVTRAHGITYLIRWVGAFTGAPPVIVESDLLASSGSPSITLASMTTGYIDYDTFETFVLGLGSGDDLLDVDSTQTGTSGLTTVSAGGGDDVLTVETTSGPTVVNGEAGADSISVNALLDPPGTTNGLAGGATRDATNALTLVGGAGSDTYTVSVWSTGSSRIVVADGTDDGATNVLNVNGTEAVDVFLLRSGLVAALNTPLTAGAGIQKGFAGAELITYDNRINAGLAVNALDGDDVFALDDNSTSTVLNGGAGDDSFFVGQMYGDNVGATGVLGFDPEFGAELVDTTRGLLTNGVSYATTINGGTGDDLFSILRNRAALQLNGEAGDDTFVIRTFLLESDPTSDALSNVSTGSGADLVTYVMNAPVAVDGGDGFDTLVLIGTEADDIFVISKDGLWGAGRYVSFVGIEKVDVDGAEGDDLFVVVSTSPTVQTRIFGGLGSDMILVGAAAPIAVADDLQGHSGIIEHSVESTMGNWTGIPVDGVGAEITDNDTPAVVMTPTGTGTVVSEAGETIDTYTLRLARTPSGTVRITVSAPLLSPDDEDARVRNVLVSFDGINYAASATATFDSANMSRTVFVKAIDDLAGESDRFVVLQHLVVQVGGDREYDGLVLPHAVVRLVDNDRPAVTVVAAAPVRVVEGGTTGSYTLNLANAPAGTVTVRVTAGPQTRVSLDGSTWAQFVDVTFTSANLPRTIHVQGLDDGTVEGAAYDTITHTVLTGDGAGYTTGLTIAPVSVRVDDNDTPVVRIIETDGGTHVVEAGDTDSYQVVLTSNPCAGAVGPCTVTVHATAKPTGTRNGPASTIRNDVQVELSIDGGATWHTSVDLVFGAGNWSTARNVLVRAVDDTFVDGSDYQVFAPTSISRVNQIQGPLSVFGGENPNAAYVIPPPYMLPGERSDAPTTTPNPAFDVIEARQVDTLVLDNGNDVAAGTGTLTYDRTAVLDGIHGIGTVTGLGMGGDRSIGGQTIAGGVTYGDLERLVVHLGKGVDLFTVLSTHAGRTEITGGAGNDVFTVETTGGFTRIDGDNGDDSFVIGNAGLLDDLGSLLVLAGGGGTDSATLDDSAETTDQLGTITQETVTGLDLVAHAGLDKIYSLTVRGTGTFTITLAGIGTTAPIATNANADQLQAALQALLFPDASSCGLPAGSATASTWDRDSRCAQSVYVFRDGNTFLVGFTGEYAGTAGPTLTSSMTDLGRNDGLNYYGLENLTLKLGSGNDGVNVRGTTAHTRLDTGAGDDLVFVSDAANLGNVAGVLNAVDLGHLLAALTGAAGTRDVEALFAQLLHGTLTTDDLTFTGSLDLVTGELDIDTGAGSNTLAVSDRNDVDADGAFTIANSAITGLAPATITYTSTGGDLAGQGYWAQQADSGLFGRGISIFLGKGGNTGRITSVRGGAMSTTPYAATLTTVWTGAGNDIVTIGANTPTAGLARLVVHGQTGNDSLVADATATQPLVLFGDQGADVLRGGAGDDLVFGDTGRVHYLRPSGADGYDLVLGGAPLAGDLTNPRTLTTATGDGVFLTADVVRTSTTGIGTGDLISGRAGNDVLMGGDGADGIDAEAGNDVVAGDYAWWDTMVRELVSLGLFDTNGGNDSITGDFGDDVLVGGNGTDTIRADAGNDWVLGDFGWVNQTTRVLQTFNAVGVTGAKDFLYGNDGDDVLAGGVGDDTITGDAGDDWIVGDFGSVDALDRELHSTDLNVLNGGADIIAGGTGADVILGGNGADVVTAGDGNDLVFGDFGAADLAHGALASLNDGAATGGDDQLHGGGDDDILMGGNFADTIWGDAGDDLVFGDFGQVTSRSSSPIVFTDLPLSVPLANHSFDFVSTFTTAVNGGSDVISGGLGSDIVLGQQGSDVLSGDEGDDDLIGGHNVAGGLDAGDLVLGGTGNDVVAGDNAVVLRTGSTVTSLVRVLVGTRLFLLDPATGTFYSGNTVGQATTNPSGVETRSITLLDHAVDTSSSLFGADTVNGEDGDDVVFGQLGNDVLRGGAGSDYVEGNGGDDTILGGLGQDDLIGGSSDLFGLVTREMRPDGRDTVYGGNGDLAGRNNLGDTTAAGHANDADVILGDNGRILKMVGALDGGYLSFTYDTAATKVVARVVVLLDYTPTGDCGTYSLVGTDRAHPTKVAGSCTNVGGGDFVHGEGGDDVVHGMTGDDALFGDGQDDDLYGEAGNDWVSGGAGQDGIVGDDGLVLTSRNGSLETLSYVDVRTTESTVTSNGPHHSATINVAGTLLKAVDLEPFYVGWNDVLYGGLGSDFVHGGEGDDAISGGEALAAYYTEDPLATLALYYLDDDPLQFAYRDPEEFRYYNENDPMRLVKVCGAGATGCLPFLTTADATGNDGDDALFGDGGSDWVSGGTGVDHLYGGWGNDLLDVDDDKTTSNGANNRVDADTNADYAFGGAGRDVLMANTRSDRLIDWIGEYNSYLVPFNPFGASTVWRASSPAVRQFLYELSKADGADQTRAPGNVRNGEPYGELGLTSSEDAEWGDQHGAPTDPQPGNGGTFSGADAVAAPTGVTTYTGSTGSSTTTTSFAMTSTTTTTTAGAARIGSATMTASKKGSTLTVSLTARTTVNVRIAVVVVGLDEVARLVTTTTVMAGATSVTGTHALGLVSGGQYEFAWMPSTDPARSDLVLVIRQIA